MKVQVSSLPLALGALLTALRCGSNRRAIPVMLRSSATFRGAGRCASCPRLRLSLHHLCLSSKEGQLASHSVHLGRSVALSQLAGAGIHLWTEVEPISKRCTHHMKTVPAYPAGTLTPVPGHPLPSQPCCLQPQIHSLGQQSTGKETSRGDRWHSDDRSLEEMTSGLWHNARGPRPTCF